MKLAYFHYGLGEARIIAYHRDPVQITAIVEGDDQSSPFTMYAPIFHVSPPIGMRTLTLTAHGNGEIIGTCQCRFNKGMHILEPIGIFKDIPVPQPLVDKETVVTHKRKNLVQELPPTDIMPLSQRYDSWEYNKEFALNIRDRQGIKTRISGYSSRDECVAGLRAALVLILTGEQSGHCGFAIWSRDDGGLQIGGREGSGTPWKFYTTSDVFPKKVRAIIELPPVALLAKKATEEESSMH